MDLLSGGFIAGNKLVLDDTLIPLPERLFPLVQDGQAVTLGMRRERVNVTAEPASTTGIQLQAEVETFESDFVHRTQTIHLRTGRWGYSGLCPLDVKLQIGQLVQAQIDPEHLYFFDAGSSLRL